MVKKISKFVYWIPRILSILFILFLALFSLDVFESASSLGDILIGLFMHNIPVFILVIVLSISWKYEIVGGIAFILAGIAHLTSSIIRETLDPWYMALAISLVIDGPAFLIGILFLIGWFKKKK